MARIAVVGTGIAGMTAAYLLARAHDVVVFEANDRIGGHTHTIDVAEGDRTHPVDTGFIVFNRKTYPGFCQLIDQLGVESRESSMSFSVRLPDGTEYGGKPSALFVQPLNALRPGMWRMVSGLLRFYRKAFEVLEDGWPDQTLGEYLEQRGYSREFVDWHLIPMGAAVWSTVPQRLLEFPVKTFVRFFANHRFLTTGERPVWRTIVGGSRVYAEQLTASYRDRIRLATPVLRIERTADHVALTVGRNGSQEQLTVDEVVLACHSDQALRMLGDPSTTEREILGAIAYQPNPTTLHTDRGLLPRARRAWSSWNVHGDASRDGGALQMTYCMNILQGLDAEQTYNVSLNSDEEIAGDAVIRRMTYHHPVYTTDAVAAQARHDEISGRQHRTHYCGAYWRYGFHEDGVFSGLRVADAFGLSL